MNNQTIDLDSNEELFIQWWLEELFSQGFITFIKREPKEFLLSEKVELIKTKILKTKTKTLPYTVLQPHVYTADFAVQWTDKAKGIFYDLWDSGNSSDKVPLFAQWNESKLTHSYIEVKPIFDQNNMTREFKINQKWVWEKYKVYINLAIPDKLFEETFTPKKYILDQVYKRDYKDKKKKIYKRGTSKIKFKVRTLEEFLKEFEGTQKTLF